MSDFSLRKFSGEKDSFISSENASYMSSSESFLQAFQTFVLTFWIFLMSSRVIGYSGNKSNEFKSTIMSLQKALFEAGQ